MKTLWEKKKLLIMTTTLMTPRLWQNLRFFMKTAELTDQFFSARRAVPHFALMISVNSFSVRQGSPLLFLNLLRTNSFMADSTVDDSALDSSLALWAFLCPFALPCASCSGVNNVDKRAIVNFLGLPPMIIAADNFPGAMYTSKPGLNKVFLCPLACRK